MTSRIERKTEPKKLIFRADHIVVNKPDVDKTPSF